ncbi:MAG: hypothetical protein LBS06_07615 [Treponema sp.]|jgi:hypothetical protein|nr:hypothetical protein [Treponema sp.]
MKQTKYCPFKKNVYITAAVLAAAVLASCASTENGEEALGISLDRAIREAAVNIEARLEPGMKIALLNFNSPGEGFSEYVLGEISGYLVNSGKLVVVDRRELDLIRQEEQFQLSGEVSDESAQSIGHKLGAQIIVSGSMTSVGGMYRFRVWTLAVESAAIITSSAADINPKDTKTASLLEGASPAAPQSAPPLLSMRHGEHVVSVAYSADSSRIVSAGGRYIIIWDAENGRELITLSGHTENVHSVAYSPDGRRIASGSYDGAIKVWDAETGRLLRTIAAGSAVNSSMTYSPDSRRIVSGGFDIPDATVTIWDAESGRKLRTISYSGTPFVTSVAYSPDGRRIVSGDTSSIIKIWDAESGRELRTILGVNGEFGISAAYSPDGGRIVSGGYGENIKIWDAESGRLMGSIPGNNAVNSMACSPNGRRIVSGGSDDKNNGIITVWDAESGRELRTFLAHTDHVNSVAYSRDGRRIVSGANDNTVKVWEAP